MIMIMIIKISILIPPIEVAVGVPLKTTGFFGHRRLSLKPALEKKMRVTMKNLEVANSLWVIL